MYTYDEIIASGYYVFREELTTHVICKFLGIMKVLGIKIDSEHSHSKIKELQRIFEFDINNFSYRLKDNYKLDDIKDFIKEDLVIVFQSIQKIINKHQEELKGKQYVKKM